MLCSRHVRAASSPRRLCMNWAFCMLCSRHVRAMSLPDVRATSSLYELGLRVNIMPMVFRDVTSCTVLVLRPGHSQQNAQWIWMSPLSKRRIVGRVIHEEIKNGLNSRYACYRSIQNVVS
jgi:hypothetical protein